jgi:hypothetical protein
MEGLDFVLVFPEPFFLNVVVQFRLDVFDLLSPSRRLP